MSTYTFTLFSFFGPKLHNCNHAKILTYLLISSGRQPTRDCHVKTLQFGKKPTTPTIKPKGWKNIYKNMESSVQGVDHVIWTGLNVEIGVEYLKFFLLMCFFNTAVKCNLGPGFESSIRYDHNKCRFQYYIGLLSNW